LLTPQSYGAPSVPDDKVTAQWGIESLRDTSRLIWRWVEQNGPPIALPANDGFALSLIERNLKHELKGEITIIFDPTDLQAMLAMPLIRLLPAALPPGGAAMTQTGLAGRRILLVEDELMISMLLETILEDENCTTVGPFGDLSSALTAAHHEIVDAAVLDINLAGEMVFPVADVLAERGVPFLLLSGYGAMGLPQDRRHWPICNKPFNSGELVSVLCRLVAGAGWVIRGAQAQVMPSHQFGRAVWQAGWLRAKWIGKNLCSDQRTSRSAVWISDSWYRRRLTRLRHGPATRQ
jgi:chemotaxis family two-component system sensor kinase Cph1